MTHRVYNFGAGPTMLPTTVMEKVQAEWLDYQGMGVSVIEISHRSPEFKAVLNEAIQLFRKLTNLPENYQVLFMHGGANLQWSALPLNLVQRSSTRKVQYYETGIFAKRAHKEATRYANVDIVASSADTNFDRIPPFDPERVDADAAYFHITGNNTIYGTRWHQYPDTGEVPLVVDTTSDILSWVVDFSKIGVMYASLQKNLGPSGVAIVIVRDDLLGQALPETPSLLNYEICAKDNSLTNTNNTFAIYVAKLMLEWIEAQGGVTAFEALNKRKSAVLYDVIDQSDFYQAVAHPDHRSDMNVPFNLPNNNALLEPFLKESEAAGLYALKGHRSVGGLRASIYNAMPMEGVEALAVFMQEFEKKYR